MSANLLLFDDVGNMWDGGSPRLRKSFGSTASDDDFSTYVVKNMGFIALHGYGRSCEIRLRPQLVSAAAFNALSAWVKSHKVDRIVTAHYTDDWVYGLHANSETALAKIEAMLAASKQVKAGDFLMRALTKEELPRSTDMHRALHSLIENWPMLSQSIHHDGLRRLIQHSLQGRYHLIDAREGKHELVFREIGKGFISYSDEWMTRAIGQTIEDQDDSTYGQWVASVYRDALKSGRPVICDVDVITSTRKLGRARLRYKRVLLPSRSIASGTWLLNSSIMDPSIDLRIQTTAKIA